MGQGLTSPAAVPHSFWQRRVVAPILGQLKQGISPEQIALTIALGGVLGIFPILGATTFLCAVIGILLRLNQPIIQLVNYLVYPVQLLLLLPFYRAGETLFLQPHVPFLLTEIMQRFRDDPWRFLMDYGMVGVYGIAVWCLVAPALIAVTYYGLRPVLQKMASALRR